MKSVRRIVPSAAQFVYYDLLDPSLIHWRLIILNSLVSLLPYHGGRRVRAAKYRLAGFDTGPGRLIHGKLTLWGHGDIFSRLRMGQQWRINSACNIELDGSMTLGDHAVLGYGVSIVTATHNMDYPECRVGALSQVRPLSDRTPGWGPT